jgi:hypothetical protein
MEHRKKYVQGDRLIMHESPIFLMGSSSDIVETSIKRLTT